MKPFFILALCAIAAIAGCTPKDQYPITAEACGPDDPVHTMQTPACPPTF